MFRALSIPAQLHPVPTSTTCIPRTVTLAPTGFGSGGTLGRATPGPPLNSGKKLSSSSPHPPSKPALNEEVGGEKNIIASCSCRRNTEAKPFGMDLCPR